MNEPGLRTLFDLDDPATFLRDHWPTKRLVARGRVERLDGLVSYDLKTLIKMPKKYTQAFFRTVHGSSSIYLDARQVVPLYDSGATIYFHSLRGPEIDRWTRAIERELALVPGATRVSAFLSRRGLGIKPHYDANDNLVCQAAGVKRWRVSLTGAVPNPTLGYAVGNKITGKHLVESPAGFPTELPTPHETIEMTPGTVMFMPRGVWHDTETLESESVHFNIQCGVATWRDVLEYVLRGTTALHDPPLREPVQALLAPGKDAAFRAELRAKLQVLVDAITEGDLDIDRDALYRFIGARRGAS